MHVAIIRSLVALVLAGSLAAATARLRLTADRTTAAVGDPITVTVAVVDAPAFSSWGATVLMPGPGIATTAQAAGTTPTWVADSRGTLVPGARFGGYRGTNGPGDPATDHPAGTHVLGRVTLRASRPGTFVLRAPGYDIDSAPFGGLLLPARAETSIVPAGTELTLTITGAAVVRSIAMRLVPDFVWDALAPVDARVALPGGGLQVITVEQFQDAVIAPRPAVNQ